MRCSTARSSWPRAAGWWSPDADTAALNSRLVAHGVRVTEIAAERRSLEDVVLSVTGSGSDRVDAWRW